MPEQSSFQQRRLEPNGRSLQSATNGFATSSAFKGEIFES